LRLATRRIFVITALSLSLLGLLLISASFRVELSVGEIANESPEASSVRHRLSFVCDFGFHGFLVVIQAALIASSASTEQ
jgi:hypothetical protein